MRAIAIIGRRELAAYFTSPLAYVFIVIFLGLAGGLTFYLGSWLMTGAMLAISAAVSALTKNQVIAFVLAVAVCFLFLMSGLELVQAFFRGWAPSALQDAIASLSLLTSFTTITQGVIDLRDLVMFGSLIAVSLFINATLVELKKGS